MLTDAQCRNAEMPFVHPSASKPDLLIQAGCTSKLARQAQNAGS